MTRRRYSQADPTANTAIGNVTRQNKVRAPHQRTRRRILAEFPEIFRGLSEDQKVSIALAAAELAGRDAWAITADHLDQAKTEAPAGRPVTTQLAVRGSSAVSGTGTIKRSTQVEMEFRRSRLIEIARESQPASVRHIYYRAVVADLVEKKQTGYRKVQRELLALRRVGILPFDWIVDEGRRAHWPLVERSPRSALDYLVDSYHRDPWQEPGAPRVELWCESESIAGTLMPLRDQYAVPIFPLKGQGSETFVWNAARSYHAGRPVVVLYAGDYDPAGLQISVQLEGKLREYAHDGLELDFRRVAIDDTQAEALQQLGTEPKQRHWIDYDGQRHVFVGQAIEAEAVDPQVMRNLFASIIEQVALEAHGYDVFARNREVENIDRERLAEVVAGWPL